METAPVTVSTVPARTSGTTDRLTVEVAPGASVAVRVQVTTCPAGLTAVVLDLVARGLSKVEIARRLGVSRPTVRRLLDNARAKLGARDRVEAAAILAAASR